VIGLQFGALLGGAVLTESVFGWPGMGLLLIDSIFSRDYAMVQGIVLVFSTLFILTNPLSTSSMSPSTLESATPEGVLVEARPSRSRLRRLRESWQRFRPPPDRDGGLILLTALLVLALAALLTSYNPERQSLSQALRPISWAHPLGTDHLGRDILARLLYGGRLSP
jgi:hypothetical protein